MNKNIKITAILTGTAITAIHIFNRIQYSLSTVKDTFSTMENKYYEWRFGKIRYMKKGSGTPLLLIHNLTAGSSLYEFHKIMGELSEKYEVYALDLLGYGLSDKPRMTYTSFLYVQLITDFVKNVIGRKTDIIVTGDSSQLAVMTCHNNPEVFNRIILINPQSLHQLNLIPTKQTKALKLLIELPILGTFVYNIINSKHAFRKLFTKQYFFDPSKIQESDIMAYVEASHLDLIHAKYTFSSYLGRYMNFNILHALKEINHSIFFIAGEKKADIKAIVENYLYYNNSIETAYIPDTKQYPHLESPQKLLSQISIFLN